ALDDDAVRALLVHPGVQMRVFLLVRGLTAVDLRRNDGVAAIQLVVPHVLVEPGDAFADLLSRGGEDVRPGSPSAEKAGHVLGTAADQAAGHFGEFAQRDPAAP